MFGVTVRSGYYVCEPREVHPFERESSFVIDLSLVRSCSISLVTLAKYKLGLLNKDRLKAVLRVEG